MEEMNDCEIFTLTEGIVPKQSKLVSEQSKLVPKKMIVILKFKPKFLFHDNFDWGRCSIRHISVVYDNVMYLCSMLDREIETPRESVERDHS